ncbi:MAG TPA: thiamine pyrophosphate-binding protein [Candidatus Acidoferrales bacterium]|jgi:acetolactate synthase-1/2/3 large subunit|nr:thiamine pyrophosphate-binding protein [Candidatus Acidoferrales bacterium]
MAKPTNNGIPRRDFLRNAAAGAAALAATPALPAKQPAPERRATPTPAMSPEAEVGTPSPAEVLTADRTGSDFMVDVIKSLGIEYICSNPGSSFRGLHESVINYGGNKNPEFITCLHEESAVAMAHGYAKIEGKPLLVFAHGTVGLQHASMAVYNAYCDYVPLIVIGGNIIDATKRMPPVEWTHSVQDAAAMLRDYTKWDDLPISLPQFAESAVRAYKIAMTPPMMPVVLIVDGELQENPIPSDAKLNIPSLALATPPQGDSAAVAEAARLLAAADNPVLIVDRAARTAAGMTLLVELAEALQAPVVDMGGRMNFPTRHPLNQTWRAREEISNADVILGLELADFWGAIHSYRDQMERTSRPITKPGAKLISISSTGLFFKSNYQNFQRYPEVNLDLAADAQATLPSLIEAVKKQLPASRKSVLQDRGARLAAAHQQTLQNAREAATYAWDASPISTARLCAELWAQIKDEDWSLVSTINFVSRWPTKLWTFDKYYQFIGGSGGYGIGYGAPSAVGAALANRKHGRLSVNIQCDGDLMYAPGVLWTAAHHRIPLLTIMHNNRAYHQEVMQVQIMADRHSRGIDRVKIGTAIDDPGIDYAKLAQGLGLYAEGPISDPKDLGPAIHRALDVVKRGEPALVDVHTQPR